MEVERNILQLNAVRIYQPYFRRKVIPDFPKHGISLVIPGAWAPASDEPKRQGPRNQHAGFSDDVGINFSGKIWEVLEVCR